MYARTTLPVRRGLLPVLLLLLAGCTVRWVSDYDEVTDRDATALLKETVHHLETLRQEAGTPAAEYGSHRAFYAGANASIGALMARAKGREKNEITVRQLETLSAQFKDLEELHRKGPLPAAEIAIVRNQVEVSIGAVIAFEMAKKRGQ